MCQNAQKRRCSYHLFVKNAKVEKRKNRAERQVFKKKRKVVVFWLKIAKDGKVEICIESRVFNIFNTKNVDNLLIFLFETRQPLGKSWFFDTNFSTFLTSENVDNFFISGCSLIKNRGIWKFPSLKSAFLRK